MKTEELRHERSLISGALGWLGCAMVMSFEADGVGVLEEERDRRAEELRPLECRRGGMRGPSERSR